jgi:hypothetical protein
VTCTDPPWGRKASPKPCRSSPPTSQGFPHPRRHRFGRGIATPRRIQLLIYHIARQAAMNALNTRRRTFGSRWSNGTTASSSRSCDDGRGFDTETHSQEGHFGSVMMRGAGACRGRNVLVHSEIGRGTTITAGFPGSGWKRRRCSNQLNRRRRWAGRGRAREKAARNDHCVCSGGAVTKLKSPPLRR